jgi:two-component system NarL family sensor kinase
VTIQVDGPTLKLRIADNGGGLPATKNADIPELGVGIPGMQSRVRQFGGDLSLTSGRHGTTVQASIPLQPTIEGHSPFWGRS